MADKDGYNTEYTLGEFGEGEPEVRVSIVLDQIDEDATIDFDVLRIAFSGFRIRKFEADGRANQKPPKLVAGGEVMRYEKEEGGEQT
jgi:hypothetical protein